MKAFLLSLCVGGLLAAPCRAQQPSPASEAKFLLNVYAVRYGENALPRIVLGKEKPAVTITAFTKCVRISKLNPKLGGVAVELKPEDAKALNDAVRQISVGPNHESVGVILWFTQADGQALDFLSLVNANAGRNLESMGILEFDAEAQGTTVDYLAHTLHP